MLSWFQKSKDKKAKPDHSGATTQGNYTDYNASPYYMRMQMEPLHGDEAEAFEYVLDQMQKQHPECKHKMGALIDWAFDCNAFTTDKQGMLRVNQEWEAPDEV